MKDSKGVILKNHMFRPRWGGAYCRNPHAHIVRRWRDVTCLKCLAWRAVQADG